jgi:hypothetical protein
MRVGKVGGYKGVGMGMGEGVGMEGGDEGVGVTVLTGRSLTQRL